MPRIIAIANHKGGVGKTTTAVNLGAAMAEIGSSVLLIDMDPQAALTASFGLDPHSSPNLAGVLEGTEKELPRAVWRLRDRLFLVPAGASLADDSLDEKKETEIALLRDALTRSSPAVDFVLIDTPPSIGYLMTSALTAATELLIPVQCQFLAMRGVNGLLNAAGKIYQGLNPNLRLLGILPTMYRSEARLSAEVLTELREVFQHRVFRTVIEDDPLIAEAPAALRPVLEYRPQSSASDMFRKLAKEIRDVRK